MIGPIVRSPPRFQVPMDLFFSRIWTFRQTFCVHLQSPHNDPDPSAEAQSKGAQVGFRGTSVLFDLDTPAEAQGAQLWTSSTFSLLLLRWYFQFDKSDLAGL